MKAKIFISTTSFGEYDTSYIEKCKKVGFELALNPYGRKIKSDELVKLASGAVGLIAGTEEISEGVLSKLPSLRVISRCGTGMDSVDIEAAKRMGILVYNTPEAPKVAVSELTVCLILALLRKVNKMDRDIRAGNWSKLMGNLLYRKNVGIIGFGRIGSKVAEILMAFGCEVAYSDPFVKDPLPGVKRLPIPELLRSSDIVSIHVSNNERIIGKEEIAIMKDGAWLINVSRGGTVDESTLYENLKNGHLAGAALDVFEQEPYNGSLKELDNVILTPHIGSYAKEARIEMERQAVENLLKGLGAAK
jgi:D-3-phosphoglycerate dehydrogenase